MKIRSILYTAVLILVCSISQGQNEFANWYFGDNAGLDFSVGNPTFHTDGATSLGVSPATISDAAGNLLFYHGFETIYDRNHNVMLNGQDIIVRAGTVPVIIPKPNSPNIYYLFTAQYDPEQSNALTTYYSEIDMTLNGGLGGVTALKNISLATNLGLGLTGVQHANDTDFWLIAHGANNADFYAFLIDENGISETPVITTKGSVHPFTPINLGIIFGYLKVSNDAKRLAAYYADFSESNTSDGSRYYIEVMDFNDMTGQVEGNLLNLGENTFYNGFLDNSTGRPVALEFSPNNKYLYVTCATGFGFAGGALYPSSLFQFDVSVATSEEFQFSTAELYSSNDRLGGIQLGLNDKIYVVSDNNNDVIDENGVLFSLGVLNSPDLAVFSSDYQHLSMPLSDNNEDLRRALLMLPQDIRQYFFLKILSTEVCGGIGRRFELQSSNDILSVLWDFGDGTTSTEISPSHSFTQGNYIVEVIATYENSVITKTIVVDISGTIELASELSFCDDFSNDGLVNIDIDNLEASIFRSGSCGIVSFHNTETEAMANSNPFEDNFTTTSNPQTIYIRVEQELNAANVTIAPIEINVDAFPELLNSNFVLCNEGNDPLEFQTTQLDSLFSENIMCALISYHETEMGANNNSNLLNATFVLSENEMIVYARVEDINTSQFYTAPIIITQKPKPVLDLEDNYYICPNQELQIDVGNNYDSYLWSTGEMSTSIEIDEPGTYSVEVTNETTIGSCSDMHTFNVGLSDLPENVILTINDLSVNNNIEVFVEGIGDYEFSIDGINYKDSPVFNNLTASEYEVFIRDKNGCGVVIKDAFLLIQPKFFTPNDDGVNDFWQIKSSFLEPNLRVEIFNRYGKLLKTFIGNDSGWDGTFNGLDLPTNDYWFKLTRPSNGRTYAGHFTLKR